jgi:hypothetical protein
MAQLCGSIASVVSLKKGTSTAKFPSTYPEVIKDYVALEFIRNGPLILPLLKIS